MAFKEAKLTRYERFYVDGVIVKIFAAGIISDDTLEETRYHEYWIDGLEMANLPQPDSTIYNQPGGRDEFGQVDPHVLGVRTILARAAKRAYDKWMREIALRPPTPFVFPEEALAVQPAISLAELPTDLPDEDPPAGGDVGGPSV